MNVSEIAADNAPFLQHDDFVEGVLIGLVFLTECAVLEAISITHVRALLKHKQGPMLYAQAIAYLILVLCRARTRAAAFGHCCCSVAVDWSCVRRRT